MMRKRGKRWIMKSVLLEKGEVEKIKEKRIERKRKMVERVMFEVGL